MKKTSVDIDEQNPRRWLLYIFIVIAVIISIFLAYKVVIKIKNQSQEETVEKFNRDFEFYKGTQPGTFVALLFDKVILNNQKHPDKDVAVSFEGIISSNVERIKDFKKKLKDFNNYEVSFEYNDDKYIKKISIEDMGEILKTDDLKGIDFEKDVSTLVFNTGFELLSNIDSGLIIKSVIDLIKDCNKRYPEHQIIIHYNNKDYIENEQIEELKGLLNDFLEYETSLNYDEDGYVNELDIMDGGE